ncbi:MAG: hypothetical protein AAFQ79_12135 [Pseudomonadota bacterium]
MDLTVFAYMLPLAYAGLQFEAFTRMTGQWKSLALMPVAILVLSLLVQFYAGAVLPAIAAQMPLIGLGLSVAYLIGLFVAYALSAPVYFDETEDDTIYIDNVLWLDAYRGVAPSNG